MIVSLSQAKSWQRRGWHFATPRLVAALTPRRRHYAWLAGGALWLGWLASLLLGSGYIDRAGQVVGTDYLEFYTAGRTLAAGQSARLYDVAYQAELQQALMGPGLRDYHAFITPPFLAWLYRPLAALPYVLSFAVWSALGLLALWLSLRWLGLPRLGPAFARTLTWYPIFASISFGQNSLLSLAILSASYRLWHSRRPWAAGLVAALILYKPQLALGLGLLWLLEARRDPRPLLGLLAGGVLLAGLTAWQMPDAARAYVAFARNVLPDLPHWQQFPLWHLHTPRGFWQLLLPGAPALGDGLWVISIAAVGGGFLAFWRGRRGSRALLFGGAVCLTLLATPHAMIYDWALLLIPAVLFWQVAPRLRRRWRLLYSFLWLAAFVSGPLTVVQLHFLPFAVQVSVPALVLGCCVAYRWLGVNRAVVPVGVQSDHCFVAG